MPVAAVTPAGMLTVNSGSRMATRQAAFLSPHAIFMCVFGIGNQGVRLGFAARPGGGGNGSRGSIGLVALPMPSSPACGRHW